MSTTTEVACAFVCAFACRKNNMNEWNAEKIDSNCVEQDMVGQEERTREMVRHIVGSINKEAGASGMHLHFSFFAL